MNAEAKELHSILFNVYSTWILNAFKHLCSQFCSTSTRGYCVLFCGSQTLTRPHCDLGRGSGKTSFDWNYRLMNASTPKTSA